ncbi:MAG: lytic transglycosylase domain-containing protein [Hyphomonadaceae bacterium]|nr:lytic transglycosylase domain-containing protein [Hyphomonadaceae bacterium]
MLRTALFAILLSGLAAPALASAPPPPSIKPDRHYASEVVSTQDAEILHLALDAASDGDWLYVRRLQGQARADIVRDMILWRRAASGAPDLTFQELANALDQLADWPRTTQMRARAEEIIRTSGLPLNQQVEWLEASGPLTGDGKVALALALHSLGERGRASEVAREAWSGNTLSQDSISLLLSRFNSVFTQEDHRARTDFLLWTRQRSEASRMMSYLTSDWRALVDARIKLQAGRRGVDAAIEAVPAALQNHPGLLYDRAYWRRRRGMRSEAVPLLVDIDGNDVPAAGRGRLWDERNIALRNELKEADFPSAYALSAPHGMSSGADFAEAEWVSGWIALRHLGNAQTAQGHFETLGDNVSTPISSSRAAYWSGRALEAMGDGEAARTAYEEAAQYNYTFYGQLAAERTGARQIVFAASSAPNQADRAAFEARPLVKALRLLAEAGQAGTFRTFAYHLDDQLESEADFLLLKELGEDYLYADIGVRGAKSGLARGVIAADAAYPVVDFPLLREPRVERPLMLALSRQESEMNPGAISHANARGLMQFIPSTAQAEARMLGLPYRTSWLTDDPGYNMTIGGAHLDTLLGRFNGSYVMTAAAYNAGASRPTQWIEDYGDPRRGEVDPVDWVEFIPFSETRNYVQRVLENTQVYRHRVSGEAVDIRLSEDLERGRYD